MKVVTVGGVQYGVLENLGFSHSVGLYAMVLSHSSGPRVAVAPSRSGPWRWRTPGEVVAPLMQRLAEKGGGDGK